jgi:hypothetical protein
MTNHDSATNLSEFPDPCLRRRDRKSEKRSKCVGEGKAAGAGDNKGIQGRVFKEGRRVKGDMERYGKAKYSIYLIPAVVDESYSRCSCTKGRF